METQSRRYTGKFWVRPKRLKVGDQLAQMESVFWMPGPFFYGSQTKVAKVEECQLFQNMPAAILQTAFESDIRTFPAMKADVTYDGPTLFVGGSESEYIPGLAVYFYFPFFGKAFERPRAPQ